MVIVTRFICFFVDCVAGITIFRKPFFMTKTFIEPKWFMVENPVLSINHGIPKVNLQQHVEFTYGLPIGKESWKMVGKQHIEVLVSRKVSPI